MKTLLRCLFFCFQTCFVFAQTGIFRIDSLPPKGILLKEGWKFHAGDNPTWAKANFDDSQWEAIDPTEDLGDLPQIRKGATGWFRIRFHVDSSLFNKPLAFQVNQAIASEIYLNGTLLKKYGTVSSKSDKIRGFLPLNFPIGTIFTHQEQVIAVRFSVQPNLPYFKYTYSYFVFSLRINTIEGAAQRQVSSLRHSHMRGFNTGMFLLLGLIHVIFYFNFRRQIAYLYFAIALLSIGSGYLLSAFLPTESSLSFRAYLAVISYPLIFSFYGFFLYLAVWKMFFRRKNIMFWFLLFCAIIGPFVNVLYYKSGYLVGLMCPMLLCSLESARITYNAYQTNRRVGVILVGLIAFFILFTLFILFIEKIIPNTTSISYWFVPDSWTLQDLTHWFSLVAIPFTLSWYLSKEYAFTSINLEKQLAEVQQLSEEKERTLLQQNAELQAAILEGQTTERKRLAADLHDNLSSTLTAVRWNLMAFNKQNLSESERKVYDEMLSMTTTAHDQVRLISHNLLPDELEKEGLTCALERLVRKLNRSGTVHFSLIINNLAERLSKKMEFELYSIVLELTHNITKHSGATEAVITLMMNDELGTMSKSSRVLKLTVSDNGKGLAENRQNGMGIQNVESRVKSLNGKWKMHSQEGKGVVFEAEF